MSLFSQNYYDKCYRNYPWVSKWSVDSVVDKFAAISDEIFVVRGLVDQDVIPPFACKFNSSADYFGVSDEDGSITIINSLIRSQRCNRWEAHSNAVFDFSWQFNSKIITVSGDQTCALWDVESGNKKIKTFFGHVGSVRTIDVQPFNNNIFATGSRDGNIIIWDERDCGIKRGLETTIKSAHYTKSGPAVRAKCTPNRKRQKIEEHPTSVTSVVYQDEHTLVSCGADDGCIKVWDTRKAYSAYHNLPIAAHSLPYCGTSLKKQGYSDLVFDKFRMVLYANCTDNVIYKYNMSSYNVKPLAKYTGHLNSSFFIKSSLSPDGEYLVSGSGDNNAFIWKVSEPLESPRWKLQFHSSEVSAVAWNHVDFTNLITCADDCKVAVWRVANVFRGSNTDNEISGRAVKLDTIKKSEDKLESPKVFVKSQTSAAMYATTPKLTSVREWFNGDTPKSSFSLNYNDTPKSTRSLFQDMSVDDNQHDGRGDAENSYVFKRSERKRIKIDESLREITQSRLKSSPRKVLSPSKSVNISVCYPRKGRRSLELTDENDIDVCTPNKRICRDHYKNDCEKLSNATGDVFTSPTINLPNLIIDGKSSSTSNLRKHKKPSRVDWLTKHGKQCKKRKIEPRKSAPNRRSKSSEPSPKVRLIDSYFFK